MTKNTTVKKTIKQKQYTNIKQTKNIAQHKTIKQQHRKQNGE